MTPDDPVESLRTRRLSESGRRAISVLFVLTLFCVAVSGAFLAGIRLEQNVSGPLVEKARLMEEERDALMEQVSELKQQRIVLERSCQIDREAARTLSEKLKAGQDERLAIEKEVSFLRRLIQEGGGGILQARDLDLRRGQEPGEFGYSFTIRQLIGDFGESVGDVLIQLAGKRDGEEIILTLADLEGSEPVSHHMKLKHFQTFEGIVRIPDDFAAENLVVEIKPATANLIPVSETFPWDPDGAPWGPEPGGDE